MYKVETFAVGNYSFAYNQTVFVLICSKLIIGQLGPLGVFFIKYIWVFMENTLLI